MIDPRCAQPDCIGCNWVAFWQKRSRDHPETAPDRGTDQQNQRSIAKLEQHSTAGHVFLHGNLPNICCLLKQRLNRRQSSRHCQETLSTCSSAVQQNWKSTSTAELEQHFTAGQVCLRVNLPNICCLLKQRLNRPQTSRHCWETLSKCSWHEPRAARLTHTLSLFCFCGLVTSKMSHGVSKSCITQHVVAQSGYASEDVRNSLNTAWCCREKLCIFSFESATAC